MSEFLTRPPVKKPLPPHSHKHSIFWQFLQATKPGDGELGEVLRRLRDRRDMKRHYPHKTALISYLLHCKMDSALVARNAQHVYSLYNQFYQQTLHPRDDSAVDFVSPSALIKSGVSREDIAITILIGLDLFSDPREQWKAGGKWVDSALGAADAVIDLFASKTRTPA